MQDVDVDVFIVKQLALMTTAESENWGDVSLDAS